MPWGVEGGREALECNLAVDLGERSERREEGQIELTVHGEVIMAGLAIARLRSTWPRLPPGEAVEILVAVLRYSL